MAHPDTDSSAAGVGTGLGAPGSSGDMSLASAVVLSDSEQQQQQQRLQRLLEDSSTTTDDCMSNPDDDSDAHSLHSRQDSVEPPHDLVLSRSGEGGASGSGSGSSVASEAGGDRGTSNDLVESARHKRPIGEEDNRGAPGPLRKACDLCTKVSAGVAPWK